MSEQDRDRALIAALDAWLDELPLFVDEAEEAATVRAFLQRVRPGARQALALRLWRETAGWRTRRTVAVWPADARTVEQARARFGEGAVLQSAETAEAALAAAVRPGAALLALGTGRPWWGRLLARPRIKIFAAVPERARSRPLALAVGEGEVGPSGQDETFWVTDAASRVPQLEDALARLGAAASLVDEAAGLRLFSLAGYFQVDDERLARAPGELTGVVGWAPASFDL